MDEKKWTKKIGRKLSFIVMVAFSKFVPSQRGGKILVDTDGYLYSFRAERKSFRVYVCRSKNRKKAVENVLKCPAKLLFVSESEVCLEVNHNHELL